VTSYSIGFSSAARQALRRLDVKVRRRIAEHIDTLEEDPRPPGCKKLVGSELWRIRIGDYRVVYGIEEEQLIVLVVRVGHRREIYR